MAAVFRKCRVQAGRINGQEVNNDVEDKLCWILLTTEAVGTFDACRKVLRFYELRWRIEEFHKAWKTGAGIERQRMQSADNLERMGVILMFVAVRLMPIREALMLHSHTQSAPEGMHSFK